jgi:methylenetetrahydrofolate dehydrogenase (NADP+) / methenyltetrahydrofolate cyclohydrolase
VKCLSYTPTLAIIQVGDRGDSTAFIGAKKAFAKKIGVVEKHIQLPVSISQPDLISQIQKCNADPSIHAIIVQLPLPEHIDRAHVIQAIDPRKDADGLTREATVMPATARGIRELLAYYHVPISGKKVTVVGRSFLVGTPIARMCEGEGAYVTTCHRGTIDLVKETRAADVLIVAAGTAGLIRTEHVWEGQVVIDVGINKDIDHRLVGDVDFASVQDHVAAITPVPGGVGPMTVCALFENVLDLCEVKTDRV